MNRKIIAAAVVTAALTGALTGCGGSGTTSAPVSVSGTVADGYLVGAEVFLDKNNNYQWDEGEPKTMTGPGGTYTLIMAAGDMGKYPVVVRAIAGSTVDEDTGQTVPNDYVMSAPPAAGGFVSPMSTLVREKMESNPGMTMAQAMIQLRNQLNLSAGMDMLADYVAGSGSGPYQAQYQSMHQVARQMAGLMADQSSLVLNGSVVNKGRYRGMMGQLNQNLPQIANNAFQGMGMESTFMTDMRSRMRTMLESMSAVNGFGNYSAMFRNMTSHRFFWNYSGGRMQPGSGMMGDGTRGMM